MKTSSQEAVSTPQPTDERIVIVRKKKKKYTKGLKYFQQRGDNATKSLSKITDAVAKGVQKYQKERDKSARKRRDGAIVDFFPNVASGIGKTLRDASKSTKYVGRILGLGRQRKYARRVLKSFRRFSIYK